MRLFFDKMSLILACSLLGFYGYSTFAQNGTVAQILDSNMRAIILEPWVVVVFAVSLFFLYWISFLVVAPLMVTSTEIYRQGSFSSFNAFLDGFRIEDGDNFMLRVLFSEQLGVAMICVFIVCIANIFRIAEQSLRITGEYS